MPCFTSCDILIPRRQYLEKWPVIACDQFTSQPEYWEKMRALTGNVPSALHCILPEAELPSCPESRYAEIRETMRGYLHSDIFRKYKDAFVYTERTLTDGTVRSGVVGAVDLEDYDYHSHAQTPVRATEKTVEERIPPRMKIRRGAALELPHVILLCDDEEDALIGFLCGERARMEQLYDLELPEGGGRVRGWLAEGTLAEAFQKRIDSYCEKKKTEAGNAAPLLFAVGDGNHSLACARGCYEELKAQPGADPAALQRTRYAMVELENIRSDAQKIESIHRLLTGADPDEVLRFLEENCGAGQSAGKRTPVAWQAGDRQGVLYLRQEEGVFPAGILQEGLDAWLDGNPNSGICLDYIHGEETLRGLSRQANAIGFVLPPFSSEDLFRSIVRGGVLPRKTFSIGSAKEKRYYLEAREL